MFDFFKLPRELRDAIYDLLTTTVCRRTYGLGAGNPQATVSGAPIWHLPTLGREFTAEYQERVSKAATLVFTDDGNPHCDTHFKCYLPQLCNVELHLALRTAFPECEIAAHRSWTIKTLAQLTEVTKVHINIYKKVNKASADKEWRDFWTTKGFSEDLVSFAEATLPKTLAVYTYDGAGEYGWETDKQLRGTWTKSDGYVGAM